MRELFRAGLLVICLIPIFFQGVSAWNVTQLTVDPSGQLTTGTPVIINGTIEFAPSLNQTFDTGHGLLIHTDLENAQWNYSIILDGRDSPRYSATGPLLIISGWLVTYPSSVNESMRLTIEGTLPSADRIQNVTSIRIQEFDERGRIASDTFFETDGTDIHEKSAPPPRPCCSPVDLTEENQTLCLHEKVIAEKEVREASVPVIKVDGMIADLKFNRSAEYRWRSSSISYSSALTKREAAMDYLIMANEQINKCNFERARERARDAYHKGNESFNDILLQPTIIADPPPPRNGRIIAILIISGIATIILVIAGYYWSKRRKRRSLE
ncbi:MULTISPECIES: hypothetical protein [unclassified Methanoregula]|uniref:hypothetical protein n=1 Tax=unclassified Methanoregula TaxID=2649730 RepID=UPI0009C83B0A|nr:MULTISPECIES: hypothetical protein [unclassified Methanoregula]OPX64244.1 MAG: hypothetical protein A4E33_01273 [Methanoregula sp. PtaB.Bin085]OPY33631.1 MAG: hypothetical protein A4E34_01954 [Methanoregula sp. PtaU1.Bin006]